MPEPQFRQETFEFSNERAGINFIVKMRQQFGRKAKLFMKSVAGVTYVKARYPDVDSPMDFSMEYRRQRAMQVNPKWKI